MLELQFFGHYRNPILWSEFVRRVDERVVRRRVRLESESGFFQQQHVRGDVSEQLVSACE
jgi:hypothetical protein